MSRKWMVFLLAAAFIMGSAGPGFSATIDDVANGDLPSPFLVVSATYMPAAGWVVVDWKTANVPDSLAPVDIYIFFKAMDSSQASGDVYFFTLDLFGLIQNSGDWTQAINLSTTATPFVSGLDMSSYSAQMPDVAVPGIVVDSSLIPDFYNASYVIYSVLTDSATGEVVAKDLDLVRTLGLGNNTPGPSDQNNNPCDFDGDGEVTQAELNQCQNQNQNGPGQQNAACDINGDGQVDAFEQEICQLENTGGLDCDLDGDGEITTEEMVECVVDQMTGEGDEEGLECDFNADGVVSPSEAFLCDM